MKLLGIGGGRLGGGELGRPTSADGMVENTFWFSPRLFGIVVDVN